MPHHSTFITNTGPASLMRCYSKKISHVVIVRAVVLGANFQYDLVFACIYVQINGFYYNLIEYSFLYYLV